MKGFGGKFGVQTDRQDKSALGWDHQEKLQLHESQKGTGSHLVSGVLGDAQCRTDPSKTYPGIGICMLLPVASLIGCSYSNKYWTEVLRSIRSRLIAPKQNEPKLMVSVFHVYNKEKTS